MRKAGLVTRLLCPPSNRKGSTMSDGKYTRRGAPRKFIEQLLTEKHEGCVKWPFKTSGNGYAYVLWGAKVVVASRLICRLAHGNPPTAQHEAAHKCGNGARGCVNPKCLYWATPSQNQADKFRHGTMPVGEKCHLAKITDSQAEEIRRDTRLQKVIAAEYGITQGNVSRIKSGNIRSHSVTRPG